MTVVVLAEKPNQAQLYADAFSSSVKKDGYIEVKDSLFQGTAYITWGYGHLVQLQEPSKYNEEWAKWSLDALPIMPDKFLFEVSPGKSKQFNVVKKLLKEATEIVVATDSDREGENIARSIVALAGQQNKPTKRLWINSLEVEDVRKGFSALRDGKEFISLYEEAQTRQISDWLVGMNASRLYTVLLQQKGIKGSFSVGRVQTPALFLIYKCHKEIAEFEPSPFWEVVATIIAENGSCEAKFADRFSSKDEMQALLNKHRIQEVNEGFIRKVEKNLKKTKSPKLHSLSSLQLKANKLWKYSPSEVLQTVQNLYEKKIVSYPRTDCHYITDSEFAYLYSNIDHYQSLFPFEVAYQEPRKGYVESSKVQEHYAVIPTKKRLSMPEIEALEEKEKNIYLEVLKNTIAMFLPDYEFEETKVEVEIQELPFYRTGKVEKKKGWKSLFNDDTEDEKEKESVLPIIHENEPVQAVVESKEGVTKPKKPYTEGQLISMMKTCGKGMEDEESQEILKEIEGIGTEATRADTIETLKEKEYIVVTKNQVAITPKGILLCTAVDGTLLSSPEMTAKWEIYLKKIGQRQGSQSSFLSNIKKFITHLIHTAPGQMDSSEILHQIKSVQDALTIGKCPVCQKRVIDKGKLYGCEGYGDGCTFKLPKEFLTKTITPGNAQKMLEKKKITLIKGLKGKSEKTFDAYLKLNQENKIDFEFPPKTKKNQPHKSKGLAKFAKRR